MRLRACVVAAMVLALPMVARAQCSDGSLGAACKPPTARKDPPLNEQMWLVLPFENSARTQDAELISPASATLLTQEFSRWRDVQVVPDDRVADLLRQLPEAQRRNPGLDASLAMARRVGAGRILIGRYLAQGGKADLTANAYETKTGTQLRAVSARVNGYATDAGLDSLASAFGRLGRGVLNLRATAERGGSVSVGTTSLAAYREYTQGLSAFNRFRPDSAVVFFRRALTLDSTFALAHVYLGVSLSQLGELQESAAELAASSRYLDELTPHMRMVVAYWRGTNASRCATSADLLRADSLDVLGWLALGDCNMQGGVVSTASGIQFAGNRNAALRAYVRGMEVDPSSAQALGGAIGVLTPFGRVGCVDRPGAICPIKAGFRSGPLIVGDSIVYLAQPYDPFHLPSVTPASAAAGREMLKRARAIAERWTAANPAHWFGHYALSVSLGAQGDLVGARRELSAAHDAALIPQTRRSYYRDAAELALRLERPAEFVALVDSMFLDRTAEQQPQYQTVLGRFSRDLNATEAAASRESRAAFNTLYSGAVPPNVDSLVSAFAEFRSSLAASDAKADVRWGVKTLATILGFHARRTGPALDTGSTSALLRFQSFLARGDTARARRELREIDEDVNRFANDLWDDGTLLFAAESHLQLADSATALRLMQTWVGYWPRIWQGGSAFMLLGIFAGQTNAVRIITREWLLYADLCMARGLSDEARRGYRMVVGLWERGEPPVQPMVARAKAALARLGG